MSNGARMLFICGISAGIYVIALALGYGWARAMHYPFTFGQRKMWTYYVLFISALPVLAPLMVAMGLWLLPVTESIEVVVFLLLAWMAISFFIVRRMSRPGGRLNQGELH